MPVMLEALYDAAEFKDDIGELKSTLRLHTWLLTANSAGLLALLGLALRGHS